MGDPEQRSAVADERLRRVQFVTDSALAHLTVEGLLDELLIRIRQVFDADTAAVLLLEETKSELVATAAKGIEEEVEQGVRLPVGGGFAGRIAATGQPVVLDVVDQHSVLNPLLLRRGIRSMFGVPLVVSGSVIGVLHVGTLTPRRFTQEDVELLQLVGDRVALAVHTRHQHQHQLIAETLQRSLLPDRLPQLGGISTAGLYRPAQGGMVGGDWYDVFATGPDSLWVVVGDVAGRGRPAAIDMARLRSVVRALAFIDKSPASALAHVNEFVMHFDPALLATMLIGVVTRSGEMTYANAGHPPPVLIDPGGTARLVQEDGDPPLGADTLWRYRDNSMKMEPGSTLVLYTDGLVERRRRSLSIGLEALRHACETSWSSLDELCRKLFTIEAPDPDLADDVAVLAVRIDPAKEETRLHRTISADARELAGLRLTLRHWLEKTGATPQESQDVLVAVGEAVANAIEHAYGPGQGVVDLEAAAEGAVAQVTVRDYGLWRPPRGNDRGLGSSIMSALVDNVDVETGDKGTTVTLRKSLTSS